jgi:TPR repeat protein
MRKVIVLLALLAAPAWAGDDNQQMNAVSKQWDDYALASSGADPATATMLSRASLAHYAFLRDAALYASTEQLRRVPLADRVLVYVLRTTQDQAKLSALDGAGVVRLCTAESWCGVSDVEEGRSLPTLSHVTLIDQDRAIGEFGPPTGSQFLFGPEFVREEGQWKVMPESLTADESTMIEQQVKRSGMTENQMLAHILASLLGEKNPAPALVTLERPMVDDADARTRLNEAWPRYQQTYKTRVQALGLKSEQGDAFAQLALGSMLVSGTLPEIAPKDEARGWKLLERSSEGGNSSAAWLTFGNLMSDTTKYSDSQFRRALVHLQRAANAANPAAMEAMGSFYFEGAGGLPRDCRQAADWQARAEEAGVEHARNERVWTLATCPIAEQRDPPKALQLAGFMIANKDTLAASELDTVAAAYAANRKFAEAAAFQQLALDKLAAGSAEITGKKNVEATRKRMQTRLRGYQRGQDYVQDYNTLEEIAAGRY